MGSKSTFPLCRDNNLLGDLQFLEEFNAQDGNELEAYMDFIG